MSPELVTAIGALIERLGFPVLLCIYGVLRFERTIASNTKAVNALCQALEHNQVEA